MARIRVPAVYIMANKRDGTIYTGVTSDLRKRSSEHRLGINEHFTRKYGCKMLVYYEFHESMEAAISREKQIKAGSRIKKIKLIESLNPHWLDLFETVC